MAIASLRYRPLNCIPLLLNIGKSAEIYRSQRFPNFAQGKVNLGMRIESVGIAVSAVPRQARCLP